MTQTVFQGKFYRITILTNQLVRMEYSVEGKFENRPTQTVVNRIFEEPEVSFSETEDQLEIHTPNMDLFYEKEKEFNEYTVSMDVRFATGYIHHWRFGDNEWNLKGTTRTLDGADGEVPLENSILSRNGVTMLDDAISFALDERHHPVKRQGSEVDYYLFAYGHAIKRKKVKRNDSIYFRNCLPVIYHKRYLNVNIQISVWTEYPLAELY